jgi:hypothetical protein
MRVHADDLIVDNFAGGGGASLGIRMCGNSVCPPVAAAIVAANLARGEVIAA